jgi:hypothetical protein
MSTDIIMVRKYTRKNILKNINVEYFYPDEIKYDGFSTPQIDKTMSKETLLSFTFYPFILYPLQRYNDISIG